MRACRTSLCLMLALLPAAVCADTLPRVAETVWAESDGSARVDIEAVVGGGLTGALRFPVQFGEPAGIVATLLAGGPASASAPERSDGIAAIWDAARRQIVVSPTEPVSSGARVRVTFTVPRAGGKGTDMTGPHRYSIINTSDRGFDDYSLEVVLPAGYAFSTVDGINASSGATPRLTSRDQHHALIIQTPLREYEGSVSVSATIVREHRTGLVPLVAVLLSAGYLIRFRDLVARRTS